MLSAEDVEQVKFGATKFREGYDQDEVDDMLDRVVATLRCDPGRHAVTSEEVYTTTFSSTRFREGYDPDEVDDFLDKVIETLEALERSGTAEAAPEPPTSGRAFPSYGDDPADQVTRISRPTAQPPAPVATTRTTYSTAPVVPPAQPLAPPTSPPPTPPVAAPSPLYPPAPLAPAAGPGLRPLGVPNPGTPLGRPDPTMPRPAETGGTPPWTHGDPVQGFRPGQAAGAAGTPLAPASQTSTLLTPPTARPAAPAPRPGLGHNTPRAAPAPVTTVAGYGQPVSQTPPMPASAIASRLQLARATLPTGSRDNLVVRLPDGTYRSVIEVRAGANGIELVIG